MASINEQKAVMDEVSNATVELSYMADGLNELLEMYKFDSSKVETGEEHEFLDREDNYEKELCEEENDYVEKDEDKE